MYGKPADNFIIAVFTQVKLVALCILFEISPGYVNQGVPLPLYRFPRAVFFRSGCSIAL